MKLAFTGLLCVLLAGCAGGGKDPSEEAASSGAEAQSQEAPAHGDFAGKHVGLSFPGTDESGRWQHDAALLTEALEAEGCAVTVKYAVPPVTPEAEQSGTESAAAPAEEETGGQQARDVSELIAAGCDLLVIAPEEGASLGDALAAAGEREIPVVSYDRLIRDTDRVTSFVSFDRYRMGYLLGEYVAAQLSLSETDDSKLHNVEFAAGNPNDPGSVYLFNGAYDSLKPYLDAGVLLVPSGQVTLTATCVPSFSAEAVKERFTQLLKETYTGDRQLDAVVSLDDVASMGVMDAVSGSYGGKNKVLVTGVGCRDENLEALVDGRQSVEIYCESDYEVAITSEIVQTLLDGDPADGALLSGREWGFACSYDTASYDNGTGIIPSFLIEPEIIAASGVEALTKNGRYVMNGKYPKAVTGDSAK